jgi:hypothetical protein
MGVGRNLFAAMLKGEGVSAAKLAYDRPSPKLLSFLAKYYQLKAYTPQANNFVVYRKYFERESPQKPSRASGDEISAWSGPYMSHMSDVEEHEREHGEQEDMDDGANVDAEELWSSALRQNMSSTAHCQQHSEVGLVYHPARCYASFRTDLSPRSFCILRACPI